MIIFWKKGLVQYMKRIIAAYVLLLTLVPFNIFGQNTDKKAEKKIERTLKSMTLRQKIGQMINVRMAGEFTNFTSEKFAEYKREIEENQIGGFTVYRGDVNAVAALTNESQRISKIPLFFAADYERGLRMQMKTGTAFTTNMGVAATGDTNAAFRQGRITCEEMRAIGVNWLFAPVVDINNNPDNPVINVRSFGEDPNQVAILGSAFVKGVQEGNCLATLKHFPGHGDTATDSHIGLSVVRIDKQRLESMELVPFRRPINEGVGSVMTAHVALPNITGDEVPSTLNPQISNDILRKEMQFNGIISTDAMEMGAIIKNYSEEKSVVMAVKAGADVVLLPLNTKRAIDSIEAAVKSGELTEQRIDESVRRLLRAKYKLGLFKNTQVDLAAVNRLIERPENIREANSVAERSITLLRNNNDFLPLAAGAAAKTLYVVVAADEDPVEGSAFVPEIQKRVQGARIIRLDPRSTQVEYDKAITDFGGFDSAVLAVFVKRAAGKGTVALPEIQTNFIRRIIALNKPVGIIAHGSPYLIRQFPEAGVYAVTYTIDEIGQVAAIRTIFGEAKFQGKLPVRIPGLFEIGAGITK